jgi:hypothetical protein
MLPPPDPDSDPDSDGEYVDPMSHFMTSMEDLFEYSLKDYSDSGMVGVSIRNEENVQDKPIGIGFRRKDQLTSDVI